MSPSRYCSPDTATHDKGRILDFALVRPGSGWTCQAAGYSLGSDHKPVWFFDGTKRRGPRREIIAFDKISTAQWEIFDATLANTKDATITGLEKAIVTAMAHFPRTKKSSATWIPSQLKAALEKSREAWAAEGDNFGAILAAEREVRKEAATWQWERTAREIAKATQNSKTLFRLWEKMSKKPGTGSGFLPGGKQRQAEALADAFAQKHQSSNSCVEEVWSLPPVLSFTNFTLGDLDEAIARQQQGATDPYGIPTEVLPHLPPKFRGLLLEAINSLFTAGHCPPHWLRSVVVPLPKPEADHSLPGGYRPVALTSLLCRLAERLVNARLARTLAEKLHPSQHGFVRGGDVSLPLVEMIHYAQEHMRAEARSGPNRAWNQQKTGVAHLDLVDAFCRVRQSAIAAALQRLEVEPALIRWILLFLSHRTIQVRWRGTLSRPRKTEVGVPQGSVLGPILFLLVADGLAKELEPWTGFGSANGFALFADDVCLWTAADTPEAVAKSLQVGITKVKTWAAKEGIRLSHKSKALLIGGHKSLKGSLWEVCSEPPITMSTEPLKTLGVLIDQQLRFGEHISRITEKLEAVSGAFAEISRMLPPSRSKLLYEAIGLSQIRHGAAAWWPPLLEAKVGQGAGSAQGTDSIAFQHLERVHSQYAKRICGAISTASSMASLAEANLLPLHSYVEVECTRLAVKIWHEPRVRMLPHPNKVSLLDRILREAKPSEREKDGRKTTGAKANFRSLFLLKMNRAKARWLLPPSAKDVTLSPQIEISLPPKTRSQLTAEEMRTYNQARLGDFSGICDGSVSNGEATAAVAIWRDGQLLECLPPAYADREATPGTTELLAISRAANFFCSLPVPPPEVTLLTDSRSGLDLLRKRSCTAPHVQTVRQQLNLLADRTQIKIRFVFAHCGWEPHEAVDAQAKSAASTSPPPHHSRWPLTQADEEAVRVRELTTASTESLLAAQPDLRKEILGDRGSPFLPFASRRADQVLLSQARTGSIGSLGGWQHGDLIPCPLCGKPEVLGRGGATIRHLFLCPNSDVQTWLAELKLTEGIKVLGVAGKAPQAVEFIKRWIQLKLAKEAK